MTITITATITIKTITHDVLNPVLLSCAFSVREMFERPDVCQTIGRKLPVQIRSGKPLLYARYIPGTRVPTYVGVMRLRVVFAVRSFSYFYIIADRKITGLQSWRDCRLSGLRVHSQARRLRVQCSAGPGVQEQIQHVPKSRVRAVGIGGRSKQ